MEPSIIKYARVKDFYTDERCYIKEIWNSQDDCLSIASARVEPGVTTAWHRLDGVDERYAVIAGNGKVEVGDMEPADVNVGDVVVIPAGVRQRITNIGQTDLIFYCICTPRFTPNCYCDMEVEL